MALWQWSKTATSNGTADPTMNWAEGIAPSIVNDDSRALMARIAEYRDDISGALTTAGTSTAYTLTTNQGLASTPNDGQLIVFCPHTTNGASATLTADGGTAFALQVSPGVALPSGLFVANTPYAARFRTASSAWIMFGNATPIANGSVTNANLASMAAWTLKGNNTSGSAAPQDFTIDALTAKGSPLAADEVPIWDAAGAAMKKATFTALATLFGTLNAAPTVQRFTSGTSLTYTPTAGTVRIKVRMLGGGGGGGAAGTNAGSAGGATSFGGWSAGAGGGGGAGSGTGIAGGGGAGTGGANGTGTLVVRMNGAVGFPSANVTAGANTGGAGAGSALGGGGTGGIGGAGSAAGNPASNNGAGGGGGSASGTGDGAGGGSGEYIEFWMTAAQIGANQTYTVGAAGNGGAAGGAAGGNGQVGIIIIEEFYI